MGKAMKLNNGAECVVDDADCAFLMQWVWQIDSKGYAVRTVHLGKVDGNHRKTSIKMHRLLTAAPSGYQVDHVNGDKLDNRKKNLRICTNSQNQMNGASYRGSSSKFRGVSYRKRDKLWVAQIQKDKKKHHIGQFECEKDAALAYNAKAKHLFGEFVRLNVIN